MKHDDLPNTPEGFPQKYELVVSIHLKHISQNGNLPQLGMKINNI